MNRVQQNELLVNRVDLASAVMVALPTLCEPVEDQHSFFWVATDSDDIRYYGQSALDCERQFAAELVRLAVCVGNGNAEKSQVEFMIKALLSLKGESYPADAYDALAAAVCDFRHCSFSRMLGAKAGKNHV